MNSSIDRLLAVAAAALVAVHQARHGERHVEHVLDVVVFGLAGPVAKIAAVVGSLELGEGALERFGRGLREEAVIKPDHFRRDRGRIGRADRLRYVVVVAKAGHRGFPRTSIGIR